LTRTNFGANGSDQPLALQSWNLCKRLHLFGDILLLIAELRPSPESALVVMRLSETHERVAFWKNQQFLAQVGPDT